MSKLNDLDKERLEMQEARKRIAKLNDKERLEMQETQKQIAKLDLENQKLLLEQRSLAGQLSKQGRVMDWLKAATAPAALVAAAITFYVGFGQIRQSEQSRLADRFDKALTRLASDKATERITGVSGLRLFLTDKDTSLQVATLQFLVNAVAVEADPLVQSAILDVFADLKTIKISQPSLNETLKIAVARNRSLTKSILDQWRVRVALDQKERMAKSSSIHLPVTEIPTPIPLSLISRLSVKEYLNFRDAERGPFERLESKLDVPLHGLARLVSVLVGLGATGKDFSAIYCDNCDFTGAADLSEATFNNAYLSGANFSHVRLKHASFRNSDLSGAIFYSSDLSNADLRDNTSHLGSYRNLFLAFPLFECADLKGADLSGTPLLIYLREFDTGSRASEVSAPIMLSAQIDDSTKLENFIVINLTLISDAYLFKHRGNGLAALLQNRRDDLPDDPLLKNHQVSAEYRRYQVNFSVNEAKDPDTMYIQRTKIDTTSLSDIRDELKPDLQGYLDQPTVLSIPLLSAFKDALGHQASTLATRSPQTAASKPWSGRKSFSCGDTEPPDKSQLMIFRAMVRW